MDRPLRIMVYSRLEHTARRQVVQGIGKYSHRCRHWRTLLPWADQEEWSLPKRMRVDGVIAFPHSRKEIDFLLGLKKPLVCVGPHFREAGLPRVDWDDEMAGRLAVEHLGEYGLKRLAFIGADFEAPYVSRRLEGARREAFRRGLEFAALDLGPDGHKTGAELASAKRALKWMKEIKPPFGVVTAADQTGFDLLSMMRDAGIHVPAEAALISIGGDNVLCPFSDPPMSSVSLPGERVGYEAARLLDKLMGKSRPGKPAQIKVAPERVSVRESSDTIATEDEMVRQALAFIRARAGDPIGIADVLAVVPLSRRPLELRFKKATGRTLQKEIWRVRLERAKEMLVETDLPVAEIAHLCGFSEPQRMTEVFGRELGVAPGSFRRTHRMADNRQKKESHGHQTD